MTVLLVAPILSLSPLLLIICIHLFHFLGVKDRVRSGLPVLLLLLLFGAYAGVEAMVISLEKSNHLVSPPHPACKLYFATTVLVFAIASRVTENVECKGRRWCSN